VSRMTVLLPHLEADHDVDLFLPRSIVGFLTGRLGPRKALTIPGIHYVQNGDKVLLAASFWQLLPVLARFPFTVARLARQLKANKVQAVISDYEPHLAWAGFLAGLPVFQMNHPGVLTRVSCRGSWWGSWGSRLMEGPWTQRVLVSFFQGDVGPLLRPSLVGKPLRHDGPLVVHVKAAYRARALQVLSRFPDLDYEMFPTPGKDFDAALLHCCAVVSPAGHQVLAEALALGKPVLALPQDGQPEQGLNAQQLVATGKGRVGSLETFEADLRAFLAELAVLRSRKADPRVFSLSDGTPALVRRFSRFLAERVVC